jgi:hypothetical protein
MSDFYCHPGRAGDLPFGLERTCDFQDRTFPIPLSLIKWKSRGAVAQLGERLVRNEEASGSIPLSSTKKINNLRHPLYLTASVCVGVCVVTLRCVPCIAIQFRLQRDRVQCLSRRVQANVGVCRSIFFETWPAIPMIVWWLGFGFGEFRDGLVTCVVKPVVYKRTLRVAGIRAALRTFFSRVLKQTAP